MALPEQFYDRTTERTPSRTAGHVRWVICAMLFFAATKNYMDRQVLGILAAELQTKLHWTEAEYGYIVSAFQAAYAIGMVLAGWFVDRVGTRIGYALMMLVWSLASAAHALVSTALGFGICRFFLGLGEGGNFPAAIKTTAEWFPQKERSFATGIFNAGTNLGVIIAALTVPWIDLHYGWRAVFVFTGALGLVWLVWWWSSYRPPEKHPRLSSEEYAYIRAGQTASDVETGEVAPSWRLLIQRRQTWAFALAKFLTDPVWWFYLYWLPKFLDTRYHLGLSQIGLPLVTVYLVSDLGSVTGGWMPAFLVRRGFQPSMARLTPMLISGLCVLPVMFAGYAKHEWIAVGVVSLAAGAHKAFSCNLFTTASDMFPVSAVGTVVGIGGMAGSVGGVLMSVAAGNILQWTGRYAPLFLYAGFAYLIALGVLLLLAPGLKRAALNEN
ncbi:MAG TPA: MFS transporter [Acidobacteriaceae bacterium]|nr:MFS transporter [Acidobacteriaceae bacterium]